MGLFFPAMAAGFGALIGVSVYNRLSGKNVYKPVRIAFEKKGYEAARRMVDKKLPAKTSATYNEVLRQQERAALLGLLGDVDSLASEATSRSGSLASSAAINVVSYLGIAVRSANPAEALAKIERLADSIEREPRHLSVPTRHADAVGFVAKAMGGVELDSKELKKVHHFVSESSSFAALVELAFARAEASTNPDKAKKHLKNARPWEAPPGDCPSAESPAAESPVAQTPVEESPAVESPAESPAVESPVDEPPVVESPVDVPPAAEPSDGASSDSDPEKNS